jgi:hypothetical protein
MVARRTVYLHEIARPEILDPSRVERYHGNAYTNQTRHFIERSRHPDDMPAVKLHDRLVVAFVGIMDHCDRMVPDRVADAIDPGDQDETPGSSDI